jgi:flagellar basal body rod protein FlgC
MQLGSVNNIASQGLRTQTDRLNTSAQRVANVNTPATQSDRVNVGRAQQGVTQQAATYDRRGVAPQVQAQAAQAQPNSGDNGVDLGQERVNQLSSLRAFQANVAVLHTSDQMVGDLLSQKA